MEVVVEAVPDEGVGQSALVAPGFEGEARVAEADGGDPVIVIGKGEGANVQNEVPPVASTAGGGEERTRESPLSSPRSGRGDVAREGGISVAEGERADPVIVADRGETANFQNELPPGEWREIAGEVRAGAGRGKRVEVGEPDARGEGYGDVTDGVEYSDQPWSDRVGGLPNCGGNSGPGHPPPAMAISGTGGG